MERWSDKAYQTVFGQWLLPAYETRARGRRTFRYRDEFDANQWKSPRELRALQWERLLALLRHAYETAPYYRDLFDAAGIDPDGIRSPADFGRLPLLEKSTIRKHRSRLMSSAFEPSDLVESATGGSTGEPMSFCYDRNSYERRTAAAMRGDGWAGWQLGSPEFYIWGVALRPRSTLARLKSRVHYAGLRRTIVNSFDLGPDPIEALVARYHRSRPRVVIGYANAIYQFALLVKRAGLTLRPPRGVISSAEKLFSYQRTVIEEVFGAPVFDRYGCREVMMIGAECEQHSGLHVTADNLYVEVVRDGRVCEPGEMGDIVVTDLHNYGMPLIRYRIGDAGKWKQGDCPCGRGLPLLDVVEGRTLDLIHTPSGRIIAGEFFPHLFKDFHGIRAYQVVQERRDTIVIRLAIDDPLLVSHLAFLQRAVADAVGKEVGVRWEMGPEMQIRQGTKFRPVVSHVPVELAHHAS